MFLSSLHGFRFLTFRILSIFHFRLVKKFTYFRCFPKCMLRYMDLGLKNDSLYFSMSSVISIEFCFWYLIHFQISRVLINIDECFKFMYNCEKKIEISFQGGKIVLNAMLNAKCLLKIGKNVTCAFSKNILKILKWLANCEKRFGYSTKIYFEKDPHILGAGIQKPEMIENSL